MLQVLHVLGWAGPRHVTLQAATTAPSNAARELNRGPSSVTPRCCQVWAELDTGKALLKAPFLLAFSRLFYQKIPHFIFALIRPGNTIQSYSKLRGTQMALYESIQTLKDQLSPNASIDFRSDEAFKDNAARWSDLKAPQPGAVVNVATESDIEKTVRFFTGGVITLAD